VLTKPSLLPCSPSIFHLLIFLPSPPPPPPTMTYLLPGSPIKTNVRFLSLSFLLAGAILPLAAAASSARRLNGPGTSANSTLFCTSGFVMDTYCIQQGTLLDRPDVRTLEGPEQHSIVCLVDVPLCVNSGYEILGAPSEAGQNYTRTVQLDEFGNQRVLAEARLAGSCSTCNGTGTQALGFSATVVGVLDDSVEPPRLMVQKLAGGILDCEDFMNQTPEPTMAPTTTPSSSSSMAPTPSTTTTSGAFGSPLAENSSIGFALSILLGIVMSIPTFL